MATKRGPELEFITLSQVSSMGQALEEAEVHIQQAKDLVSKNGYGGMFVREEIDSWMKHTAQLFRLHRIGRSRLSTLSYKLSHCIHCGDSRERYHTSRGRCIGGGATQFEVPQIRHDAWKEEDQ